MMGCRLSVICLHIQCIHVIANVLSWPHQLAAIRVSVAADVNGAGPPPLALSICTYTHRLVMLSVT